MEITLFSILLSRRKRGNGLYNNETNTSRLITEHQEIEDEVISFSESLIGHITPVLQGVDIVA